MIHYREILRLDHLGLSQRRIAESCDCARSTVQDVLKRAQALGITWPLDEQVGDEALFAKLYPRKDKVAKRKCPIDFERVQRELSTRGTTRMLLWKEYCNEARSVDLEPYSYPRFCEQYRD